MEYYEKKIRGFHLDLYGHVNNARYLEFLEEARWEMLEKHFDFHILKDQGHQFVIVNIDIHFKQGLKLAEVIRIQSCVKEIGMTNFTLRQSITSQTANKMAAYADVKIVIIDGKTQKPARITGDLLDNLNSLPRMHKNQE